HLVLGANGDSWIFLAEFEQHELAARLERLAYAVQHALGPRKFVIDVDQDHQVEFAGGQLRIGFRSQHRDNVRYMLGGRVCFEPFQHAGLDIVGIDHAPRRNALRNPDAVEAGSGSYVSDHHSRFKIEFSDGFFRLLFRLPLVSLKPVGSAETHYGRNSASGDRMNGLPHDGSGQETESQETKGGSNQPAPVK